MYPLQWLKCLFNNLLTAIRFAMILLRKKIEYSLHFNFRVEIFTSLKQNKNNELSD